MWIFFMMLNLFAIWELIIMLFFQNPTENSTEHSRRPGSNLASPALPSQCIERPWQTPAPWPQWLSIVWQPHPSTTWSRDTSPGRSCSCPLTTLWIYPGMSTASAPPNRIQNPAVCDPGNPAQTVAGLFPRPEPIVTAVWLCRISAW